MIRYSAGECDVIQATEIPNGWRCEAFKYSSVIVTKGAPNSALLTFRGELKDIRHRIHTHQDYLLECIKARR